MRICVPVNLHPRAVPNMFNITLSVCRHACDGFHWLCSIIQKNICGLVLMMLLTTWTVKFLGGALQCSVGIKLGGTDVQVWQHGLIFTEEILCLAFVREAHRVASCASVFQFFSTDIREKTSQGNFNARVSNPAWERVWCIHPFFSPYGFPFKPEPAQCCLIFKHMCSIWLSFTPVPKGKK